MGLEETVQIGTHIFYRPKREGAQEAASGETHDPPAE
jgi:hypothetical protein